MAEQEKQEESMYPVDEAFERQIEIANGTRVEDDGGSPEACKERRQGRGEIHRADFDQPSDEEALTDALDSYDGPKHANEVRTDEDLRRYAYYREALFAERHPDYHDVVNRYLMADLEKIPQDKLRAAMLDDNFPAQAYAEAKRRQRQAMSGAPSQLDIDTLDPDEFGKKLNDWARSARSAQDDEEDEGAFVSRLEKRRMARLPNDEFEKHLDWLKQNRGD
jgi:hypothetical protein